jgi:hypothetical protein
MRNVVLRQIILAFATDGRILNAPRAYVHRQVT